MKLSWKKRGDSTPTPSVCVDVASVTDEDDVLLLVRTPTRTSSNHSPHVSSPSKSLGSGHYSPVDGSVVKFVAPPPDLDFPTLPDDDDEAIKRAGLLKMVESTLTESTTDSTTNEEEDHGAKEEEDALPAPPVVSFLRHSSSFLRVADLHMDQDLDLSGHDQPAIPHYHCSSVDPPPGLAHDPAEKWVALEDTPMLPWAVDGLTQTGLAALLDPDMWTPDAKTRAILQAKPPGSWERSTFASSSSSSSTEMSSRDDNDDHVLIWSGAFCHGLYGSDLPAIRSAAVIAMPHSALLELLVDSSRVREYNSMSLGRTDLWTLPQPTANGDASRTIVTKIMRSESRPPLLRKILQFTSIFHARHYEDGYLLVTRAVEHPSSKTSSSSGVVVSEILLGVNVIRPLSDSTCLLLTVNHIRSPMVPMYIAKRLGLQAAVNFVQDLRRCGAR